MTITPVGTPLTPVGTPLSSPVASFVSPANSRAGSPVEDMARSPTPVVESDERSDQHQPPAAPTGFQRFANMVQTVRAAIPAIPALPAMPGLPGLLPELPPRLSEGLRDIREISAVVREILALARNPEQIVALRNAALGEPAAPGAAAAPSDMRLFIETVREIFPTLASLLSPQQLSALRNAALGEPAAPGAAAAPSDARVIVETIHAMLPSLTPLLDPARIADLRTAALGEPAAPGAAAAPSDARVIVETIHAMLPSLTPLLDPARIAHLRTAALGEPAAPGTAAAPSDARVIVETASNMLPSLLPLLTALSDPTRLTALRTAALGEPAAPGTAAAPSNARVIVETASNMLPSLLPLLTALSDPTRLTALRTAALGDPATPTSAPSGPSDTRVIMDAARELVPSLLPLLTALSDPTRLTALRTAALGNPATTSAPSGPSDSRVMVDAARELVPSLLPLLTALSDPTRLTALRTAALGDPATTASAPSGPSDIRVMVDAARELVPSLLPFLNPDTLSALRRAALGDSAATASTPSGPSDIRVMVDAARELVPSLLPFLDPDRLSALRRAALGDPAPAVSSSEPSDIRVVADTARQFLPLLRDALQNPERAAAAIEMIRTAALGAPADPAAAPAPASSTLSDLRALASTVNGVVDLTRQVLHNPDQTAAAIRTVMTAVSPPLAPATAATASAAPAAAGPSMLGAAVQIAGAVTSATALVTRALDDPAGTGAAAAGIIAALRTSLIGAPNADGPSILESLRNWTMDSITGIAKSVFLEVLGRALAAAITEIETAHPNVAAQLRQVLEQVQETQRTNGELAALKENILGIINGNEQTGRILQIHFDRLMPVTLRHLMETSAPSAEERLTQILNARRRAREEGPALNHRQGIMIQRERAVQNVGAIAAMQLASSRFCLDKIDGREFSAIIADIPRDADFIKNVKKRFYAEIDRTADLPWIRKILAKSCFGLVAGFVNLFLGRFISSALKKLEGSLTTTSSQRTQETHNAAIDRANDFLTILKGVLKKEQINPSPTESYPKRVEKALGKPEFNHGWGQQSLYAAAGSKAIDNFLPPLGWHANFSERIASMPIVFNYLLHIVAGSVVWISEALSNAAIRSVLKNILYHAKVVDQLVTLSESHIVRNGYTHAINKLIHEQLLQMWETIHEPQAPEPAQRNEATVANKQYLRTLITNLFEVLTLNQQAQFSTSDPSIFQKMKQGIDKLSIDLNVDVIALILDQAKNEFLKPATIPMRAFQVLEAINAALETQTTATEDEMTKLEADIEHLSNRLVNKAVGQVIHSRFHADPNEGTDTGKEFLKLLQAPIAPFAQQMTELLNNNQKEQALALSQSYVIKLRGIQRSVNAEPSLTTNKDIFNRSYTLPLTEKLEQLERSLQAEVSDLPAITAQLQDIQTWSAGLEPIFNVNLALFRIPGGIFEKVSQIIAFNSGKEFIESIWGALRTPYNWRYGAWHHGLLLPLVESKVKLTTE